MMRMDTQATTITAVSYTKKSKLGAQKKDGNRIHKLTELEPETKSALGLQVESGLDNNAYQHMKTE